MVQIQKLEGKINFTLSQGIILISLNLSRRRKVELWCNYQSESFFSFLIAFPQICKNFFVQNKTSECNITNCTHSSVEQAQLKTQLICLEKQLDEKDQRIKQLEYELSKKTCNAATQVKR